MSTARSEFLDKVRFELGAVRQINRSQIKTICDKYDLPFPTWLRKDPTRQISRGVYALTEHGINEVVTVSAPKPAKAVALKPVAAPAVKVAMVAPSVVSNNAEVSLVPEKASGYVPFGHFNDVRSIIKSKKFYPTYVTGLSDRKSVV